MTVILFISHGFGALFEGRTCVPDMPIFLREFDDDLAYEEMCARHAEQDDVVAERVTAHFDPLEHIHIHTHNCS